MVTVEMQWWFETIFRGARKKYWLKTIANALRRTLDERKKVLEHSHSLVFNSNPNAMLVIRSRMGRLIIDTVNETLTKMTGWTAAELERQPISMLSGLGASTLLLEQLAVAAASRHATTNNFKCQNKYGEYFQCELKGFPLDDSGDTESYLLTLQDIEQDLSDKSDLLNWLMPLDELTTFITTGLLTINTKGYISYTNERCLDLFGLNRWDMVGKHLCDLDKRIATLCASDSEYVPIEEDLDQLSREGDRSQEKIRNIRLELPTQRILQRVVRKGKYKNRGLVYYSDITTSKRIEERKSNFLATAAHELRNPMTCIIGFVELLQNRDFDKERSSELLNIISKQSHAITNLLNELLDLARIEQNRGKVLNLAVEEIRPVIECALTEFPFQEHRLITSIAGKYPAVRIDKGKIIQALSNLINNSLKYSSAESQTHIFLKIHENNGVACRLGIVIRDQGIGMTQEQLSNFGKPFWRANPSGSIPGTGLGISLVKEIVDLHEGQFGVISECGKGTEITVWLPVA